ncbi:pyruvate kinase [bacterium]|nr:pyruvate kinase [bacterium]
MNNQKRSGCPFKRTKIVATVGPACRQESVLKAMIEAGVDVFRINFSHFEPSSDQRILHSIKKLRELLNRPVALLGDLRGPRIRVGDVTNGEIGLTNGQDILLTPESVLGTKERISISYPGLAQDVKPGTLILVDNGVLIFEVLDCNPDGSIKCSVKQGGLLHSRRGINLPGVRLSIPALTQKDYTDIAYALEHDFDFLALSFVQSAQDIIELNQYLASKNKVVPVIAKIENQFALKNIESIVEVAYGVMVARGDLALEMSIQDVPIAQKKIISICRQHAVPVITATQMLETMIENRQPTRAEATDIANAILDGTDALMLSGETAIGAFPIETVTTMSTIACKTEQAWFSGQVPGPSRLEPKPEIDATIGHASTIIAETLHAVAIVTHTTRGSTARRVSQNRPPIPIIALSSTVKTRWWLALSWGVSTEIVTELITEQEIVDSAIRHVCQSGLANPDDILIITAGVPFKTSGKTNLIRVERTPSTSAT